MFKKPRNVFFILMALTVLLGIIDLPENFRVQGTVFGKTIDRVINPPTIQFSVFGMDFSKSFRTSLGLDLAGGSHVALEADMKSISEGDRVSALESAKEVIDRRVNFFGVTEPVVQTAVSDETYRILVEMPGITDIDQAISLIGQTAKLEFREFRDVSHATDSAFVIPAIDNTVSAGITGSDLARSSLSYSQQTGSPEVAIEFTAEGKKKFSDVTTRLVGKQLAIFLDDMPVTAPVVQTVISDGRAVITGNFTRDTASELALQLNAGALPVPVSVVEHRMVGATLGAESIAKSIRAGFVGLGLVAVFMVLLYGKLGVIADIALVLYGLLSFGVFRFFGITLTLPGIAGFILSIGMAVDANILIFERFKEEKREGKPWAIAMEQGFGKAWDSIRDANLTTIITCLILYNPTNWQFLPSSGMVRGFAVTLLIGVLISLFTGIAATRTYIRVLYKEKTV